MEITVQYTGQLAGITGVSEENVPVTSDTNLRQLVMNLAQKYPAEYLDMLLTKNGEFRPSLLVIVNGEQADGDFGEMNFADSATVMLMTPIAGG